MLVCGGGTHQGGILSNAPSALDWERPLIEHDLEIFLMVSPDRLTHLYLESQKSTR